RRHRRRTPSSHPRHHRHPRADHHPRRPPARLPTTAPGGQETMSQTVSDAVARREDSPGALIARYSADFATVLPTHIRPETWVRLAQGALRRNPQLEQAAKANPGSLLAAL